MSIMQGGPGFPLLTDSMYHYMSKGEVVPVETEDENLPLQVKSLINQVSNSFIRHFELVLCITGIGKRGNNK